MPPKRRSDAPADGEAGPSKASTPATRTRPAPEPLGRTLIEEPPINTLHEVLQSSPDGLAILSFYRLQKTLDHANRDELSQRIIVNELKRDLEKRLNIDDFKRLTLQILELFPSESEATWLLVETKRGKRIVTGRLRHKYYNVRRHFIKVGLISRRLLEDELVDDENLSGDLKELEEDDDIVWLQSHTTPYTQLLDKWTSTLAKRKALQKSLTVHDYINKFACLKVPHGWEWLTNKFEQEHPVTGSSVNKDWPTLLKFLERELLKKKEVRDIILECSNEVLKLLQLLLHFCFLFRVRTVPKSTGCKETWRPSRPEVQESFFVHIKKHDDLKEHLAARNDILSRFKVTQQPFVVVVGPSLENIHQYLVVVDNIEWRATSALHALDICFKVIFSLSASYQKGSRHIWLLIQKCVYKLTTEFDYDKDVPLRSFLACHLKDFDLFLSHHNELSSL